MSEIECSWMGRVAYQEALNQQREARLRVIAGTGPEIVMIMEHNPVVTTGRRVVSDLPSKDILAARGIDLVRTERGGLATYHGPGQLIAYPIINAWERGLGAKGTVHAMEAAVIDWLEILGIRANRRSGFPGVWVNHEKICAVGMHFRKGVSMHGIALNLDTDLDGFETITPCGIEGVRVTSVARIRGHAPEVSDAAKTIAPHIVKNLMRPCSLRSAKQVDGENG